MITLTSRKLNKLIYDNALLPYYPIALMPLKKIKGAKQKWNEKAGKNIF